MKRRSNSKRHKDEKGDASIQGSQSIASSQGEAQRLLAKRELNEIHNRAKDMMAQGKYRQAFEAYVEYGDSMSKTKGLAGAEAVVLEGARKFEELALWQEAGNLYLIAANLLSNRGVIPDAGNFYLSAATDLEKTKDNTMRGLIATCYGAASQALRGEKGTKESDDALMKGVITATGKNPVEIESSAYRLFRAHNLRSASEMFQEASSVYTAAIGELSDLTHNLSSGSLAVDVKSVLHHRAAQAHLASAACLAAVDNGIDAPTSRSNSAADNFTRAVINFTPLFSLGEAHKVDYRRYSYDLMMATILRTALGSLEEIEMLESQLFSIDKAGRKSLKASGYLTIAQTLMRTKNVMNAINDLNDLHLGTVDELKGQVTELLIRLVNAKKGDRR
jgi:tetratricopeptide (TPR) repeat protein